MSKAAKVIDLFPVAGRKKILHTGRQVLVNDEGLDKNGRPINPVYEPEVVRLSLSPSKLLTSDECKDKLRVTLLGERTEGGTIYTAVGTAAHYVVEQINKGAQLNPDQREDLFRMKLMEICNDEKIVLTWPPSYKEAKEIIKAYEIPKGYKFISGEALVQLEFELFTFRYMIDAVLESDDEVLIIDYKTNAAPPKSNLQLLLYAWATSIAMPEIKGKKIRAAFHMLRTDKMIYTEVTAETLVEIQAYVNKEVDLIEKLFRLNYFPKTPEGGGCHWCPLDDCEVRGSTGRW